MKRPIIGLALGGGAAKGFAHIGVLKALEEHGIDVDMVSGSSIGALIGGLYCAGRTPTEIEFISRKSSVKDLVDIAIPTLGMIKGNKIEKMIIDFVGKVYIEDLNKVFISTATDLNTSKKYVFKQGPLHTAIRASISIPGVFEPLIINDMVLVDGGIVDIVPTSELKLLNADLIIAVDLGTTLLDPEHINIVDVVVQTVELVTEKTQEDKNLDADIIISPDLSTISPSRFDLLEKAIDIGYRDTILRIDDIKAAIKKIND